MIEFPELNIRINHHGMRDLGNGHAVADIHYYMTFRGREEKPEHWYFCLTQKEFEQAARGHGEFADIAHRLSVGWGLWSFYDVEFGQATFGEARTRFYRAQWPTYASKILARYLRRLAGTLQPESSLDVTIPLAWRERLLKRYGQGKGMVELDADEKTKQVFETSCEGMYGESLRRSFESPMNIARNSTSKWTDKATLKLWSCGPLEFGWVAYSPTGRRIMNGAIVLHGAHDNGGDGSAPTFSVNLNPSAGWSVHT